MANSFNTLAAKVSKISQFKPYRSWSLLRALIFAMALANVAAWYLVATQAEEPYKVRYVLFCATDQCSNNEAELDSYAKEIQTWFGGQISRTYQLLPTIKFQGTQPASFYNSDGSNNTDNAYYKIRAEAGLLEPNVKTVVLLGFRALSNCGVGSGPLAIADFSANKSCPRVKSAVLAHELGHTLLSSDNSDHLSDGTLMHAPLACNGRDLARCSLNREQGTRIAASPWFTTVVTAPPPPPSDTTPPTTNITAPASGANVSGTINITADASDNTGVTRVDFYIDGTNFIKKDMSPPFAISYDTTKVSSGNHALTARAFDAAGNSSTSAVVSVNMNAPPPPPSPTTTTTFSYTGAQQTYVVPAGVSSIKIDSQGAQGYSNCCGIGGLGGRVQTTLAVTPGETLYVYVGQLGISVNTSAFNGGGIGFLGGGGGASDIRKGGFAPENRVIIAGGGGGAGYNSFNESTLNTGAAGGVGGGNTGGTGANADNGVTGGGGGGISTGGKGGVGSGSDCTYAYRDGTGAVGSLGQGGSSVNNQRGGGGGAGYYGGGQGGYYEGGMGPSGYCDYSSRGGGGGGSSFAGSGTSSTLHTQGYKSGDGLVIITSN